MNDKIARATMLGERFAALFSRAQKYEDAVGPALEGHGKALLDNVKKVASAQIDTLMQLRQQLEGGNSFLSGFTLWQSNRNANKLERLMDRAEEEVS